jgi:Flp pilus assembly pilin Flp
MQLKLKSLVHSVEAATRGPRRLARRQAQSMVEYAIIAALVAVVALVAVKALGTSVTTAFDNITQSVNSTQNGAGH